jgi:hypothetical protein
MAIGGCIGVRRGVLLTYTALFGSTSKLLAAPRCQCSPIRLAAFGAHREGATLIGSHGSLRLYPKDAESN